MATHRNNNLSDQEAEDTEEATTIEQPNSGVEELPAMQDTASIPASEGKMKKGRKGGGKKGGKKGGKGESDSGSSTSSGYTGLNKYRADMNCSSCSRSMVQTGAITTEDLAITKKIPLRADGKSPYRPMPGVGQNKGLAVVCDDCIRQSKPPEQGGTNMPITYKTVVVMTQEGKVINIPVTHLK